MKNLAVIFLTLLMLLTSGVQNRVYAMKHTDEVMANIRHHLSTINEPADSLPPLLNLFDLEQAVGLRKNYDSLAVVIYDVALRAGNSTVALEMLRHQANSVNTKGLNLKKLLKETERFEGHADKKATETFILMRLNRYYTYLTDADSTQTQFQEQLREITVAPPKDIYDNIVKLHAVCMHLSKEKSRELLPKYFGRLETLVDSVHDRTHALASTVYLHSALAYSDADVTDRALESDRKLLELMDTMDMQYEAAGRPFREYGNAKYMAYRRMLRNWRDLSSSELENLYAKANEAAANAPQAQIADRLNPLVDIYYNMGKKNYSEAKPLLEKALARADNNSRRTELLRDMMIVAKATDDTETYMNIADEYVQHLHTILNNRLQERYKELQVAYDINQFKSEITSLKNEKKNTQIGFQRTIIWISLSALLVLLILLFFLIRQYSHSRKLAQNLAQINKALVKESESLRKSKAEIIEMRDEAQKANQFKTTFMRNLGREISVPLNSIVEHSRLIVDCIDSTNKPYLTQYAEMIQFNGDYITTVVNDVLHLAQLDSDSLSLSRSLVDIRKIAELVIDTVTPEIKEDVKLVFDPDSVNPIIYTDPRRVQQILMNVVSNAAKFTASGTVTLQCNFVNQGKMVAISVTDTGVGIDPKYKDVIFDRFVKIDDNTPGAGLGLPLARMLARLLGGDLTFDSNYRKGARFVLTIPNTTK
ncbi:MAG: HAMP domain-containing histidine kinase [Muribaculaceae bacterium]|nr:HAMP domain-containing histidine kinase [Muribaculaceae bacterium]